MNITTARVPLYNDEKVNPFRRYNNPHSAYT